MLEYELQAWKSGHSGVAGVDEAGRGPLAGPVVAAAVQIERGFLEREQDGLLRGMNDSKKLTAVQRESLNGVLTACDAVEYAVGVASVEEIDAMNILRATHTAMARAVQGLPHRPPVVLVDGLAVSGLPCESRAIVRGDSRSLSIASASIVAKVWRDRLMVELDQEYPGYGFSRNKGYGTREHVEALRRQGPCVHHRRSFSPVSQLQFDLEGGA